MKELNEKLKNVNHSNTNDKDDTVDYFDPGDKGENNVTWLKLKITAEYVERIKKTKMDGDGKDLVLPASTNCNVY